MNKIILVLLLIVTGCTASPKFQVGDCVIDRSDLTNNEFLPSSITYRKIVKIGKYNYLYLSTWDGVWTENEALFDMIDNGGVKVPCPEFK
jgi:hypothetical protein